MKKVVYSKNIILMVIVFLLSLGILLAETFLPSMVLPRLDIPLLTLLCVIAMIIERKKENPRKELWFVSILMAGLTFAIFPLAAGWNAGLSSRKLFAAGAIVFGITDLIYKSMYERMGAEESSVLNLGINGFVLYLASLGFQAIL